MIDDGNEWNLICMTSIDFPFVNEWMQKSTLAEMLDQMVHYSIYLDLNGVYPFNLLYIFFAVLTSFSTESVRVEMFR